MNRSDAQPRDAAPSKSIRAHPWFAKMIGLWFAALFGLSSLALAPEMLERIVTTLSIDRIVPAAAPPLGWTARLLLAMGIAGLGEIVGLLIGARLAKGRRTQPEHRRKPTSAAAQADAIEDAPRPAGEWLAEPEEPHESATDVAPCSLPVEAVAEQSLDPSEPGPPSIRAVGASAPARIAATSLDELGVVQLSERLALALQARRERWAKAGDLPPPNDEAANADEIPVLAQKLLKLRQFGNEPATPEASGNPDPDETDRALRAALASLQRVSGGR